MVIRGLLLCAFDCTFVDVLTCLTRKGIDVTNKILSQNVLEVFDML